MQGDDMIPFALREVQYSDAKEALAGRAAKLLNPGDAVIVDGGTTTFHLASCLPSFPLHIITNSLRLASVLDEKSRHHKGLEVFLTGGYLYPNSGLLVGPGAQSSLAQYHARWAFLSVGGLTTDGLFNTNELVVETERRMIASAERVAVLADASKINRHAMCQVCTLDEIDCLVTNHSEENSDTLKRFEDAGVEVIRV